MNKNKFLMICFISFAMFTPEAFSDEVHDTLKKAITCQIDSLEGIRNIVAKGSHFKNGYSVTSYGDGSGETSVVILGSPVEIAGAKSYSFFGSVDSMPYFNFAGLVYGKFKGDYKKVISELHLTESSGEEFIIGKFQRKIIDPEMPNFGCPLTIGLTPIENGEFVLGCGHCNGG